MLWNKILYEHYMLYINECWIIHWIIAYLIYIFGDKKQCKFHVVAGLYVDVQNSY